MAKEPRYSAGGEGARRDVRDSEFIRTTPGTDALVWRSRNPVGRPVSPYRGPGDVSLESEILAAGSFGDWLFGDDANYKPDRLSNEAASIMGTSLRSKTGKERLKTAPVSSNQQPISPKTAFRVAGINVAPVRAPIRSAKVPTTKELMMAAAERLPPSTNFFGNLDIKEVRGNVSPVKQKEVRGNLSPGNNKSSTRGEVKVGAREARTTTTKSNSRASPSTSLLSGSRPKTVDCVERPTGNYRGPGKYRGQFFNWCK